MTDPEIVKNIDITRLGEEAILIARMIELIKFLRDRYYHAELYDIFSRTVTHEGGWQKKESLVDKFMLTIDEIDRLDL